MRLPAAIAAAVALVAVACVSTDPISAARPAASPDDAVPVASSGAAFVVYMAPDGSDARGGRTPDQAVRTLGRVEEIVAAADRQADVEVRIARGTYTVPSTHRWTTYVAGHTISFMPVDYQPGDGIDDIAGRPVFRGDGDASCWFSGQAPAGTPGGDTNLRFHYLQVERFSMCGIELKGAVRTDAGGITVPANAGANGNVVSGMYFRDIGSKHASGSVGYGSVTTRNSSGNVIRNNHFVANENVPADAGLMHGVYLNAHSNGNTVADNRFDTISGGPMRVRHDSNDNDIHGNRFVRAGSGVGFYSEWFCGAYCLENDPDHPRECASHGNTFHDNRLVSGYDGSLPPTWTLKPDGQDHAGAPGCDNEGEPRVRAWGNVVGPG